MSVSALHRNNYGMVGERGFEPPAPCSQSRCATKLRHSPLPIHPTGSSGQGWCCPGLEEISEPLAVIARGPGKLTAL